MGLFSSIASFFGASTKKKAAQQAAGVQMAAAQQGIDAITGQNAATQASLEPFIGGGTKALGAQENLLGLNGDPSQESAIQALQDSPLYRSLFRTGQETVLQNASATGGLRGGDITSSLANFGSDTLAKVIQQQLGNLFGLTQVGANTAVSGGQIGANAASGIAQLFGQKGQAQAGGILGKAAGTLQQQQAIASGIGDLIGTFDFSGAGGAGGGSAGGSGGGINLAQIASTVAKFM